ncbi:MAG: hypothetical protein ACKOKB_01690 [Bacteroidota bacterium]
MSITIIPYDVVLDSYAECITKGIGSEISAVNTRLINFKCRVTPQINTELDIGVIVALVRSV